ncbi:hypothetical protein FANTH_5007 [Fusarium anthophilum]|uniref:Uncharacterized protein n=1 Tax=Fusarium anthophilum TaxID=48485 RepID=A0A8H4ZNC2_9HYPO|nr:hypothetical protein FANTH_5007 [Fusarium anthophilum]
MADNTPGPSAVTKAKATVRVKGKDSEYGKTLEFDTFQSLGGNPEDLMDEERWLDDPKEAPERVGDSMATALARRPTEKHWAFRLLARACKPRSISSDAMIVLLGISAFQQLTAESEVDGIFVGISATNCEPVIMLRDGWPDLRVNPIPLDEMIQNLPDLDNTDMVMFQSESVQAVNGHEIIWTESMLIPGNISYAKRALWDRLGKDEKTQFVKIMVREHSGLGAGLTSAGVAKILPSNKEQERKPAICRTIHGDMEYSSLHYVLQWPPMAVLEFPPEMVEAMEEFLSCYPQDNVPLNIALAAAIIYFDLEEGDQHRSEGFIDFLIPKTTLVKKGSLSVFILYFPHMLRFVETNHLTAFIHPTRFATMHYSHDTRKKSDGYYGIKHSRGSLDENEMRSLYSKIWTRHPQVPADFRFPLIPASMPGTCMVFPQDCAHAQKPTSDLHTLCCLNDIRTMGFPDYGVVRVDADLISGLRSVGGPEWVFSKMLNTPFSRLDGPPWAGYWKSVPSKGIKALTGVAKTIGPVFPHVGSSCYEDVYITECVKRHFGMLKFFTNNFSLSEHLPSYILESIRTKSKGLRKVFTYLGKKRSGWSIDPNTLTPSWKGMSNDLKSLHEKGELEKVASGSLKRAAPGEQPTSAPKRVKLAKRCLSTDLKTQILDIMDDLDVRSLDWYPLRQYLTSTTNPSLNEAWDLFSEVQSLKSEIQKTFPTEDPENGQRSLDEVIRVCSRAAGLFDWQQAKSMDYEQQWDKYREGFSKVDKTTAGILNTLYKYRKTDGAFEDFLPMIGLLRDSSMIECQVDACTAIEDLLEAARTIVKIRTPSQNDQAQS